MAEKIAKTKDTNVVGTSGSQQAEYREQLLRMQTLQKIREKIYQSRHDLLYCYTHLGKEIVVEIIVMRRILSDPGQKLEWRSNRSPHYNILMPTHMCSGSVKRTFLHSLGFFDHRSKAQISKRQYFRSRPSYD
jgi:hypothetical protein